MPVLSDSDIQSALKAGSLGIDPFSGESLSSAGYDLRCGGLVEIQPGGRAMVHTLERLCMPADLCGQLFIRSSFAREGLFGSFALVDPGFRGQLTLSFFNAAHSPVTMRAGERIAQIVFQRLTGPSSRPYAGRYQDSEGAVPSKRLFQSDM